jgi:hypothetical protein
VRSSFDAGTCRSDQGAGGFSLINKVGNGDGTCFDGNSKEQQRYSPLRKVCV